MALRLSDVEEVMCPNGKTLVEWLKRCSYFASKRIHVVENTNDTLRIRLYTARHCYGIKATDGYLGCIASTRTPRPGEDWTRGNDLPDGKFCERTFQDILGAIVFYEALEVAKDVVYIADVGEASVENFGTSI